MECKKKVAFYTLGCKVNQYETESIKNQLMKLGYEDTDFENSADVYIINSCTVTSVADKKTRNMMRRAKKINPDAIIILTGCYAQTNSKELLEIDEIDYVVGNTDKQAIVKLIQDFQEKKIDKLVSNNIFETKIYEEYEFATLREMSRAYVKIQDGCNSFCSYCKIPFARGRSRSRLPEQILKEIEKLTHEGFKEIILIGINIGAYGEDFEEKTSFEELVEKVIKIKGVERIRFGSVYPDKISDRFIELFKSPKVLPHVHISLQSGDDTILSLMKRKYGTGLMKERLEKLRNSVKNLEFTADVIVGFPGETDELFENTAKFIESIGFSDLHVFQYSDRENTAAEKMPGKIDGKIKKERAVQLEKLREKMYNERAAIQLGRECDVLIEEIKETYSLGHSDNYFKIKIEGTDFQIGEVYKIKIGVVNEGLLVGEKK
ncbi:MAG: tRNA (N(6)-L-threonylcarbamoyladenosine(37)-C(2))-methylthiotransferase MtaB [Fusobacteriaceae bacterium]